MTGKDKVLVAANVLVGTAIMGICYDRYLKPAPTALVHITDGCTGEESVVRDGPKVPDSELTHVYVFADCAQP